MGNFSTTFWQDFIIADRFGIPAVKDTFRRAFGEWKRDYRYLTDLVLVLNHKIWEHYEKNEPWPASTTIFGARPRIMPSITSRAKSWTTTSNRPIEEIEEEGGRKKSSFFLNQNWEKDVYYRSQNHKPHGGQLWKFSLEPLSSFASLFCGLHAAFSSRSFSTRSKSAWPSARTERKLSAGPLKTT